MFVLLIHLNISFLIIFGWDREEYVHCNIIDTHYKIYKWINNNYSCIDLIFYIK